MTLAQTFADAHVGASHTHAQAASVPIRLLHPFHGDSAGDAGSGCGRRAGVAGSGRHPRAPGDDPGHAGGAEPRSSRHSRSAESGSRCNARSAESGSRCNARCAESGSRCYADNTDGCTRRCVEPSAQPSARQAAGAIQPAAGPSALSSSPLCVFRSDPNRAVTNRGHNVARDAPGQVSSLRSQKPMIRLRLLKRAHGTSRCKSALRTSCCAEPRSPPRHRWPRLHRRRRLCLGLPRQSLCLHRPRRRRVESTHTRRRL